jgi:hypothetical protein
MQGQPLGRGQIEAFEEIEPVHSMEYASFPM